MTSLRLTASVTLLAGAVSLAAPVARAAPPTKLECLTAAEGWLKARRENHLHEARSLLLVCASTSCPRDVHEECARHVTEVNAAIPSVVFIVKDAAGADLAAVTVTMDGKPLADRIDGSAVEVEPGEHTFQFSVSGQPPVDKTLLIHQGELGRRVDVVVGTAPPPVAPAPVLAAPVPGPGPAEADHRGGMSGGRIAAIGLAGVGVAGIVVGSVLGASASSKWSQAKSDCGAGCGPDAPAQAERSDAQNAATLSTIGFVAGGVGLAAAAVLWFVSPGSSSESHALRVVPAVGPSTGGLTVLGAF